MPRHANYIPHGVIPAVLLPFFEDLSIDEASYRSHLCDVTAAEGGFGVHDSLLAVMFRSGKVRCCWDVLSCWRAASVL